MKSYEVFAALPPALGAGIMEALAESDKEVYRTVVVAVAQVRKVRPIFLDRQPRANRFPALAASLGRPALAVLADNSLRTWLIKKHSALLADFLDALQIPHENGVVESLPQSVEDDAVRRAIDLLLQKHPPEPVAIYLRVFNEMNDAGWENFDRIVEDDPRLKLGNPS